MTCDVAEQNASTMVADDEEAVESAEKVTFRFSGKLEARYTCSESLS